MRWACARPRARSRDTLRRMPLPKIKRGRFGGKPRPNLTKMDEESLRRIRRDKTLTDDGRRAKRFSGQKLVRPWKRLTLFQATKRGQAWLKENEAWAAERRLATGASEPSRAIRKRKR